MNVFGQFHWNYFLPHKLVFGLCRESFNMSRSSTANQSRFSTLEKPRRNGRYSSSSSRNSSREVLCDFCLAKKNKAVKSCLTCLTSFCETHLQAHYEYPALMKHKLVAATGQLREKICAEHDKLLEVFCRSDQACVCVLCIMEEHRKHDIVSAAAERTEKQVSLSTERTKWLMPWRTIVYAFKLNHDDHW